MILLLLACADECDGTVAADWRSSTLGAPNAAAISLMLSEKELSNDPDHWLGVVPGTSEQWGHHKAPPAAEEAKGVLISAEYQQRLDTAFLLFQAGAVRYLLITGGTVDADRPDYNEAERGEDYLLRQYGEETPDLAERILLDPLAEHSTTNLRNADKLSVDVGLCSNVVITTIPARGLMSAYDFSVQGFYFLYHGISSYDAACKDDFGYTLGDFSVEAVEAKDGTSVAALRHDHFPVDSLRRDDYGP